MSRVVSDAKAGTVLHVGEDRKKETLTSWWLTLEQLEGIESVSMDIVAGLHQRHAGVCARGATEGGL